jgi:hypothetical protein
MGIYSVKGAIHNAKSFPSRGLVRPVQTSVNNYLTTQIKYKMYAEIYKNDEGLLKAFEGPIKFVFAFEIYCYARGLCLWRFLYFVQYFFIPFPDTKYEIDPKDHIL